MAEFVLAILLFLTAHVVPPAPLVRRRLVALLGRRRYLLAYSVLSLSLLVWIIVTVRNAPYMALWNVAPWPSVIPVVAMPLAFYFVVAGLAEPNPLSISLRRRDPTLPLAPIVVITRHPVRWGFLIWAAAYLPPNAAIESWLISGAESFRCCSARSAAIAIQSRSNPWSSFENRARCFRSSNESSGWLRS
ncbi:NnrU family protein [Aurantimonas sp. C2-3-R2]|uniref:NnrU family protein n=1 Tax=unclassified Aurantimonas TaxID=2638230 RepID=UPI003FA41098